jgi:hypothetical protein
LITTDGRRLDHRKEGGLITTEGRRLDHHGRKEA